MGDGGTANPHIEPNGASAEWQSSQVHYEPAHLRLQLPPGRQQAYTDARTNKDPECRPIYWKGVDWRKTRAGKVLVRGAYVSSRSSGVQRIKGGSVQIN